MKKGTLLLLFGILLLLCAGTQAASVNVRETVLPNRLKILTSPNANTEIVSVNVYVRTGSRNESSAEEGISHFLEHLFFRGTQGSSGAEFKNSLEALGGMANAETSKDYTRYYINVPAENGLRALDLLTDALQNASLNETEIEQERKVILEEYQLTGSSPSRQIGDMLFELAYPDHPYRKSPIGTEKNIKAFKRSDFIGYREKFYAPENLIFVITGNFDETVALSKIRKAWSPIPAKKAEAPSEGAFLPLEKNVEKNLAKGSAATVSLGFYGPAVSDERIYAADVMCFMLGIGEDAYLNRELVEKKKSFLSIGANFLTMKDPGLITVQGTVKDKNGIKKALGELQESLENFSRGDFTQADIQRAANLLKSSFVFGNETSDGLASTIGYYEAILSYRFAEDYIERINGVTKEDIMAFTAGMLRRPHVILTTVPEKKYDEDE